MPKKIFSVQLSTEERQQLQSYIHHGRRSARSINRARILLLADAQCSDDEITTLLGVNRATVHRIRQSYYEQPYDPRQPVVCFDERPCQLIDEVLVPIPMKPGRTKRQDDEYVRQGTCCVLMAFEPLGSWRFVQVRMRRTAIDYASFMQELI